MSSFSLKFKNFTIVFPFHTAWECAQYLPYANTAFSLCRELLLFAHQDSWIWPPNLWSVPSCLCALCIFSLSSELFLPLDPITIFIIFHHAKIVLSLGSLHLLCFLPGMISLRSFPDQSCLWLILALMSTSQIHLSCCLRHKHNTLYISLVPFHHCIHSAHN